MIRFIGLWIALTFVNGSPIVPEFDIRSYKIGFVIRNAGINVNGSFEGLKMDLRFNPDSPEQSSIAATIDVSTIKTSITLRDKHLLGREYFYQEKYPVIRIESLAISALSRKNFKGVFRVTIRDISREIEIPFTVNRRSNGLVFKGSFELNRLDFGLGSESIILSDTVTIDVEFTASQRQPDQVGKQTSEQGSGSRDGS